MDGPFFFGFHGFRISQYPNWLIPILLKKPSSTKEAWRRFIGGLFLQKAKANP